MAAVLVVALLSTSAGWAAWTCWPPLIQFRIGRTNVHTRDLVQRYLHGQLAFEPTARKLAILYQRKTDLIARLPVKVAAGRSGSVTGITLPIPEGVSADDPRLVRLGDRAMELMMGPEAWARLQALQRERRGKGEGAA